MAEAVEFVTRAVVFPLDVSPSEERLLMSYCGARRFAYNWVLATVKENLEPAGPSARLVYPTTT